MQISIILKEFQSDTGHVFLIMVHERGLDKTWMYIC